MKISIIGATAPERSETMGTYRIERHNTSGQPATEWAEVEADTMDAAAGSVVTPGEMLAPSYSGGDPQGGQESMEIYEVHRREYLEEVATERRALILFEPVARGVQTLDAAELWDAAYPDGDPHADTIHVWETRN